MLKLRNLRVAPAARLLRSTRLERPARRRAELSVTGMICALWAHRVKRALEGLPGATTAEVSLTRERATVDYDPRVLSPARMIEAVRRTVVLPTARRAIERAARPRRTRSRASRD